MHVFDMPLLLLLLLPLLVLLLPPLLLLAGLPLSSVSEHLNMLLEAAKVAKSPTPGGTLHVGKTLRYSRLHRMLYITCSTSQRVGTSNRSRPSGANKRP
jgi:hypothetical protein